MLADDLVTAAAARAPQAEALACAGRRLTFGDLAAAVTKVAGGLRGLGVRRGDRVAIHLDNSVEAVLSIFGALRAGAVFVPINPTTKADKLAYVLRDSEARVLVSDRRVMPVVSDARRSISPSLAVVMAGGRSESTDEESHGWFVPFEQLAADAGESRRDERIDLDLAALIYTSGSTGRPKGVMLSHANIIAATTSINGYLGNRSDDAILDVLPLSFDYGLYQLFLALQSGARVVLERSFAFPTLMLELAARERITALPIVPMIAALLLKHDLDGYDLSSLRYITNTGAVLPQAHITALRERLPHVRIFSMYGLTECKRVSYLSPADIDDRPTSVGKAMDNVEVYVVDDEGRRSDSGVGELVVRGPNVMQGYWKAEQETARVLRPGPIPGERVLHTGDIFRIDADGYMYFLNRTDDVLKSRGQKVSPREVENVLYSAPGVCEAVVIGVPDAIVGQAVQAYVTLHPGATTTSQDLILHCSRQLEDFMVPRTVEVVPHLPHTTSGKIARRQLIGSAAN